MYSIFGPKNWKNPSQAYSFKDKPAVNRGFFVQKKNLHIYLVKIIVMKILIPVD